ncbi:MAG: response regulator transcription factor [Chloroflexi bacterium]|nr:response regulator transcription factor [Chloroflexota bacterium]
MNRVLIIAVDPLARAGLAALLANQRACAVVGQIARDEIAHAVETFRPDVIVGAFERDDDLREWGAPVIALVPDENAARDAWSSGARGVLSRNASAEKITATIGAIAQGLAVFDPAFVLNIAPARAPLVEELTPRETQVLQLLAQGKSNKTIARELDISEHTVKFHVNAILGKLNAQSRTEAVVLATRLGLVML